MQTIKFKNKNITPGKIVCVGRNYHDHIVELNNKVPSEIIIFSKPNSSISKNIKYFDNDCHFETELSFLVTGNNIEGIAVGFDFTKRKLQSELKSKGLPWERAKCFDGATVFSKFIEIEFPLSNIEFKLSINNEIRQEGKMTQMINSPIEIMKEIKTFMSLNDGDVIMTGTPKGVSNYKKNDLFRAVLIAEDEILIEHEWQVN